LVSETAFDLGVLSEFYLVAEKAEMWDENKVDVTAEEKVDMTATC
jgi:hypothetical protein